MKLVYSLIAVAFIISAVTFIRTLPKKKEEAPVKAAGAVLSESQKNFYRTPRALEVKTSPEVQVSEACSKFWNEIENNALESFFNPEKMAAFSSLKECAPPEKLLQWQERVLKDCAELIAGTLSKQASDYLQKSSTCTEALFFYRAAITHFLTRDKSAKDITEAKVLLDKMVASMFSNPEQLAELAERLLEIDPTFYVAAKGAVLGKFFQASAASEAKKENSNSLWNQYEDALERARKMNPGDPELVEAPLVKEVGANGDMYRLNKNAEELSITSPDSGLGPYYQAVAQHRLGDVEAAKTHLAEAIKREPNNARYKEALENVTKGQEKPFSFNLSFQIVQYPN